MCLFSSWSFYFKTVDLLWAITDVSIWKNRTGNISEMHRKTSALFDHVLAKCKMPGRKMCHSCRLGGYPLSLVFFLERKIDLVAQMVGLVIRIFMAKPGSRNWRSLRTPDWFPVILGEIWGHWQINSKLKGVHSGWYETTIYGHDLYCHTNRFSNCQVFRHFEFIKHQFSP